MASFEKLVKSRKHWPFYEFDNVQRLNCLGIVGLELWGYFGVAGQMGPNCLKGNLIGFLYPMNGECYAGGRPEMGPADGDCRSIDCLCIRHGYIRGGYVDILHV